MAVIQKRQAWVKPVTGERVDVSFDGKVTRVRRGAAVTEFANPPWNEEAAKAAARESLKPMFAWTPFQVDSWRDQLIGGNLQDVAVAKAAFLAAGMPAKLWDDIDAYKRMIGFTLAIEPNQPMKAPEGGWSVQIVEDGQSAPTVIDGTIVIHADDPALADSLLFHPTPEVKAAFENLYLKQNVGVGEPPADTPFAEQAAKLRADGFVQVSAREDGGALFLPQGLAPYRAQITQATRPVIRLAADKSRKPQTWESKVGGAPYRLQGQPWPVALDTKATPLVFLAQINYGQLNANGAVLADHPSQGLLQIFISNTEFYGVAGDHIGHLNPTPEQRYYRVIYHADVTENAAALDANVAEVPANPDGYTLPFDCKIETALIGIADEETVTACDVGASMVVGVDVADFNDTTAEPARNGLWDIAVSGHKVGGYPNFTQRDPRKATDDHILLLQLDSDQALGLMWGDVGIANFFIRPADLKDRDFSRVNFNWDCG